MNIRSKCSLYNSVLFLLLTGKKTYSKLRCCFKPRNTYVLHLFQEWLTTFLVTMFQHLYNVSGKEHIRQPQLSVSAICFIFAAAATAACFCLNNFFYFFIWVFKANTKNIARNSGLRNFISIGVQVCLITLTIHLICTFMPIGKDFYWLESNFQCLFKTKLLTSRRTDSMGSLKSLSLSVPFSYCSLKVL